MSLSADPSCAISARFSMALQWCNGAGEGCAIDGGPLVETNQWRTPAKAPLHPSSGHNEWRNIGGEK